MNNSFPTASIWDNQYVTSALLEAPATQNRKMQSSGVSFFLRKRYLMVFLTWLGVMFMFILRTNLSLAIVEMTSAKNITIKNETFIKKAEFDWDRKTEGFVLSVFSIGYLCGPLGGILALKFGGVNIFGIGMAVTGFLTILTPLALRMNVWIYILCRMLEGIFESFSMTCTSDIFVRWAPPNERSRLLVFSMAGANVALLINYPFCGFLAYRYGWESIFYVTGGMTLVWYILWLCLAVNDPTTDSFMTHKERDYFRSFSPGSVSTVQEKPTYPWRKMFTCAQFWIYLNELFTYFWTYSFLAFLFPLYLKDAFDISIQDVGFISGIPSLFALAGLLASAFLSDYLRSNSRLTKSFVHRLLIGTGQLSSALGFILVALWANYEQSIVCFAFAKIFVEFAETSYHILVIDLFYKYTALVRGFGVTVTGVAYFLSPILVGFMISDHTKSSWNSYFLFLSALNIWSLVIYYLFGSADTLEWAAIKKDGKTDENKLSEINVTPD